MKVQRNDDAMTMDEVALRAALNVLRDSVESKRMPSGLPLEGDGLEVHEKAIDHLEAMLRKVQLRGTRGGASR